MQSITAPPVPHDGTCVPSEHRQQHTLQAPNILEEDNVGIHSLVDLECCPRLVNAHLLPTTYLPPRTSPEVQQLPLCYLPPLSKVLNLLVIFTAGFPLQHCTRIHGG